MSGSEIENLVVAAEPAGIDETTQGLEEMEQQFDETSESFGDTAADFSDTQSKWMGAATAILGGIVTVAGGLLTQIPIVGETVDRFAGILDGLIFQIDKQLRPGMTGLNKRLTEMEKAVFNASGPLDAFVTLFQELVNGFQEGLQSGIIIWWNRLADALGIEIPQGLLEFLTDLTTLQLGDVAETLQNINFERIITQWFNRAKTAVQNTSWEEIGQTIADFIQDNYNPRQWAKTAINRFAEEIKNRKNIVQNAWGIIKDTFETVVLGLVTFAVNNGPDIIQALANGLGSLSETLANAAGSVGETIEDKIQNTIDDGVQWGKDLINGIITGLENRTNNLADAVQNHVADTIDQYMPGSPAETGPLSDLDEVGPGLVDTVSTGMQQGTGQLERASAETAGAMEPDGFGANRSRAPSIILDGREVSRGTSRYRDDGISRQGRFE